MIFPFFNPIPRIRPRNLEKMIYIICIYRKNSPWHIAFLFWIIILKSFLYFIVSSFDLLFQDHFQFIYFQPKLRWSCGETRGNPWEFPAPAGGYFPISTGWREFPTPGRREACTTGHVCTAACNISEWRILFLKAWAECNIILASVFKWPISELFTGTRRI